MILKDFSSAFFMSKEELSFEVLGLKSKKYKYIQKERQHPT